MDIFTSIKRREPCYKIDRNASCISQQSTGRAVRVRDLVCMIGTWKTIRISRREGMSNFLPYPGATRSVTSTVFATPNNGVLPGNNLICLQNYKIHAEATLEERSLKFLTLIF